MTLMFYYSNFVIGDNIGLHSEIKNVIYDIYCNKTKILAHIRVVHSVFRKSHKRVFRSQV